MITIEITGATGTGPYDIYVCDITLTYCYLVSSATTIPPTYTVTIPIPLDGASQVIVKLIDSLSCETIQLYTCLTPTPTPTLTPTPTPTPIINCNCISFNNTSIAKQDFTYTQCDGIILYGTINPSTILYVCGKLPTSSSVLVVINILGDCLDGSCPAIPVICFAYYFQPYFMLDSIIYSGYYLGFPYYTVNSNYVWWNSIDTTWYYSSILGDTVTDVYSTLYDGSITGSPIGSSWVPAGVLSQYMTTSTLGPCPM
jgi:hypothetical protein